MSEKKTHTSQWLISTLSPEFSVSPIKWGSFVPLVELKLYSTEIYCIYTITSTPHIQHKKMILKHTHDHKVKKSGKCAHNMSEINIKIDKKIFFPSGYNLILNLNTRNIIIYFQTKFNYNLFRCNYKQFSNVLYYKQQQIRSIRAPMQPEKST